MRRLSTAAWLLLLAGLLAPAEATAQRFGQWAWDARVGFQLRAYANSLDGDQTSSFEQRDLRFQFGLNGYLVHPALASFRAQVNGLLSRYEGAAQDGLNNLGFRVDLRLLPRGRYRTNVFVARDQYDHRGLAPDDPLASNAPGQIDRWGVQVRAVAGRLRGATMGINLSRLRFLAPGADPEVQERAFLSWTGGGKVQHRYRLERQVRDYGSIGYRLADTQLQVDEHGRIAPRWRWDFSASGLDRESSFAGRDDIDSTTIRVNNRFHYEASGRNLLTLEYRGGLARLRSGGVTDATQTHTATTRFDWYPVPELEVAPFVLFTYQLQDGVSLRSPQAGLALTWKRTGRRFDALAQGAAAYGQARLSGPGDAGSTSLLTWRAQVFVGHGDESGLRKEIEGEYDRNGLRPIGQVAPELSDQGARFAGIGTTDWGRARMSLRRVWGRARVEGYGELRFRDATDLVTGERLISRELDFTLQATIDRLRLMANTGNRELRGNASEELRHIGATLSWTPWRNADLRATYRADFRDLLLSPDVDRVRYEAGAAIRLGLVTLDATVFATINRFSDGGSTVNNGITVLLFRDFFGGLPIVTARGSRGR